MAEETTPVASTEAPAPSDSGQAQVPTESGNSGSESPASEQEGRQPQAEASSKQGTDLYKDENFKKWQAKMDQQQARLQAELREAREQANRLATAQREAQLAKMSDLEKTRFYAQEARQEADLLRRELELVQGREARQRDLQQIAEKTGTPLDVLDKANTYEEAQEIGLEYMRKMMDKAVKEKVKAALESQSANKPDTGGGATRVPQTKRQEALAGAQSATDYVKALMMND